MMHHVPPRVQQPTDANIAVRLKAFVRAQRYDRSEHKLPHMHALPPRGLVRLMIRFMVSAPERWSLPLVGANEMGGCVLFRALRDKGVELFADEPAVAERIRLLYNEILGNEIGQVGFIAVRLGERVRAGMRRLYTR